MKEIKSDELYVNLSAFLKGKGIELAEGSYSQRIRQGCALLADAVNLTQAGFARAKSEIDEKFNRMRQAIHQQTAPKKPATGANRKQRSSPTAGASPAKKARSAVKKTVAARPPRKKAT